MIEIGDLVSVKNNENKHAWIHDTCRWNIVEFIGNDAEFQARYPDGLNRKPISGDELLWYIVVDFLDIVKTLTRNTDDTYGRGVVTKFDEELGLFEVTFPEASFRTQIIQVHGLAHSSNSVYPETPNTKKIYFKLHQLNVYGKD